MRRIDSTKWQCFVCTVQTLMVIGQMVLKIRIEFGTLKNYAEKEVMLSDQSKSIILSDEIFRFLVVFLIKPGQSILDFA
jgi:hypothetical protein